MTKEVIVTCVSTGVTCVLRVFHWLSSEVMEFEASEGELTLC